MGRMTTSNLSLSESIIRGHHQHYENTPPTASNITNTADAMANKETESRISQTLDKEEEVSSPLVYRAFENKADTGTGRRHHGRTIR